MNKKILIISLSAGSGHTQAGNAIYKTAKIFYPNLEVQHIDCADYINYPLKKIYINFYEFLVDNFPYGWKLLFETTNKKNVTEYLNISTKIIKQINSYRFFSYIKKYKPDHIVCTNFFPAELLNHMPKSYGSKIKKSILITDYYTHEMWKVKNTEYFFVATNKIIEPLLHSGIDRKQIIESGIPIDPEFFLEKSTETLRKSYQLENKPTILIMSGGKALDYIEEILYKVLENKKKMNVIVVCGKNDKLYQKLIKIKPPQNINLKILAWTNKVDEYMRMSDIVVTKPGGLTTTECLILRKPIFAINPIPGQEEENLKYIKKNKLGVEITLDNLNGEIKEHLKKEKTLPIKAVLNPSKIILDKILAD